nr:hypothetical protein [Tanacetum cinerariifolium]
MVAYLTKSDASEGFNQVIDFLNGTYIKYALTVNPNIYVSCIKQFWNTIAIKKVNDVTRLQALVDKNKVVVIEAAIREVLWLDDAEGVDCLPNEEIFTVLARMDYEKPSTKLTFYKAFFLSHLVRNVDSTNKFYMYPCFLQLLIRKQVGDLSTHTTKHTSPALTQKVFANMRRVGKGFSRVDTPLFEGMLGDDIAAQGEVPTITQETSIPSPTPTIPPSQPPHDIPSTYQALQSPQRIDTSDDTVMDDESNQWRIIDEMDKDDIVVLIDEKEEDKKVDEAKVHESTQVQGRQAESQAKIYKINMDHASKVLIPVVTITDVPAKVAATPSRRRKGVVIRDPEEESTTSSIISIANKSKDKGKGIMVEEPKPLKKKQQIEIDEEYARKLHVELNKDIECDVAIDHVKLNAKEDPAEENIALHTINETLAEKAAKRRKLDEEVDDLKRHLEIVPDEDDDVYTEATPLVRKVPVVDYEIIELNNKPYYKIIRADGAHQLYISFLTLLKNFDREDLEAFWNLVKESLEESKDYTWSSKGQELEATGIMWCAYHNIYNHTADFVSGKKCCQAKLMVLDNAAEERLMLLSQVNAANVILMLSRQS